jgi:ABC-type cobalamin/Fe3+-siderophores transport system ATPase subunit
MAGAEFVRVDLHVHTHRDTDPTAICDFDAYVQAAIDRDVRVIAITDHNHAQCVRAAIAAGAGKPLLVVAGVEVSTHDGHLLALFDPEKLEELDAFVAGLNLVTLGTGERRSQRSVLDLVGEIDRRGGLAIPAHVDTGDGLTAGMTPAELEELLTAPALAGLEFRSKEALETWFTNADPDPHRLAAWKARQRISELRERGLARLMSSDAHSVDNIGLDRASRLLTRSRLDDLNFDAIRNAIQLNPKARCKAEALLPVTYPRIKSAEFTGGFLDGVRVEFSDNLTCVIGGRGSGKSTALLAVRAAVGAAVTPEDDPDLLGRMPDRTTLTFVDSTGAKRTVMRDREGQPTEPATGAPVLLRLADLGQDESGRLAKGYHETPGILLEFLDGFVVKHEHDEREQELMAALAENATDLERNNVRLEQMSELETQQKRLKASLEAAQKGQIEEVAKLAQLLASEEPFVAELESEFDNSELLDTSEPVDLSSRAAEFGVDLTKGVAKDYVPGPDGLETLLVGFEAKRVEIRDEARSKIQEALQPAREKSQAWQAAHKNLRDAIEEKRKELAEKGLEIQAGAVQQIATRLQEVTKQLGALRSKREAFDKALGARDVLLERLHANREALYQRRRATLKRIADAANDASEGLRVHVHFEQGGQREPWVDWLRQTFSFRSPRVERVAARFTPAEFAKRVATDFAGLLAEKDEAGPLFQEEQFVAVRKWPILFGLQTMPLEDLPRIEVQLGGADRHSLDRLSAGQQRSVLLSLLLCAERSEPIIIDQPEDHLDARYIAASVVRHLEAAKERRQVILATHSANLTVLGDAELVIPMRVEDGKGRPFEVGAVDRPSTRDEVCAILEGGTEAYRRRGQRYGFSVRPA